MARDLHPLVARELGVDLAPHALGLLLQVGDLALGADAVLLGVVAQLLDLLLQLEHRLLEVQPDRHLSSLVLSPVIPLTSALRPQRFTLATSPSSFRPHPPPFPQRTRQLGTRDLSPAIRPSWAPTRNRRERIAIRE